MHILRLQPQPSQLTVHQPIFTRRLILPPTRWQVKAVRLLLCKGRGLISAQQQVCAGRVGGSMTINCYLLSSYFIWSSLPTLILNPKSVMGLLIGQAPGQGGMTTIRSQRPDCRMQRGIRLSILAMGTVLLVLT